MSADSREFSRITRVLKVEVDAPGRRLIAHTRNLSLRGALLITQDRLPTGSAISCEILLDNEGVAPRIAANGHVVRHTAQGVAIQFDELIGPESYAVLRQLLMYNAVDPARIEQECEEHVGLMPAPGRGPSHRPPA